MMPSRPFPQRCPPGHRAAHGPRRAGADLPLAPGQIGGATPAQPAGESFGSLLGRMVQEVNASQNAAKDAVQGLQSGDNVSLHQAVIAMEEASISFQLMVEVRNKLLESTRSSCACRFNPARNEP